MTLNVIYFVKAGSLWRRVVMPSNYATAGCSVPWQQPSCNPTFMANPANAGAPIAYCKTQDIKLVDNMIATDFVVQYFNAANSVTSDAVANDTTKTSAERDTALQPLTTVGASITVNTTAAGRAISQSGTIRTTKLDVNASTVAPIVVPVTPVAPVVSSSLSAPTSAVFSWPTVQNATSYTFKYNTTGGSCSSGSWTTAFTNQNTTTYTVADAVHSSLATASVVYGCATATNANATVPTSSWSNMASLTIPMWAAPLLQNNWTNYGGSYAPAAYTKTSEGVVVFRGLLKRSGTAVSGEVLFQLPTNYRPNLKQIYTTITNPNAASRIDVDLDGSVKVLVGDAGFLSLDGIKFVPSATTAISFQAMTLANSWVNFDAPTHQVASYAKDTLNRTFTRGVIKNGSTTAASLITALPSSPNYQSPSYLHIPAMANSGYGFFSPSQTNATYPSGAGLQYKGGGNGYFSIESMFYNNYTGWTALSMANGWVWYSSAGIFSTPAYIKASDGIVSLKGLIQSGTATSDTTVANLPAGFRPSARLMFNSANNSAVSRVDVLPDGQVRIMTGGNVWLALDNINFIAEQ